MRIDCQCFSLLFAASCFFLFLLLLVLVVVVPPLTTTVRVAAVPVSLSLFVSL